jgi:amino acid transporter
MILRFFVLWFCTLWVLIIMAGLALCTGVGILYVAENGLAGSLLTASKVGGIFLVVVSGLLAALNAKEN